MNDRFTEAEAAFMRRALELAKRGEGRVSPNPPVGCVLARDGRVIAEGWHNRLGDLHAEGMALASIPPDAARGATAYVTLSPCATRGRQPPCADALAKAGIAEVVAATVDPNPGNASGLERLRQLGVPSRSGLLRDEAEYLMRGFFSMHRRGRPYLTLKYAMTLDGKIATATGDSRWISNPASREVVQDMRSRSDAVMVGIGTALADDPLLTVREPTLSLRGGPGTHPQPLRVVVDSHCRLSPEAALFDPDKGPGGKVIVAAVENADASRTAELAKAGAEIVSLPPAEDRVPLRELLVELGRRGVNQVLCEGGGGLAAGLLAEELVDEAIVFIAPKIVGGKGAAGPVSELGISAMADARLFTFVESRDIDGDILIRALMRARPVAGRDGGSDAGK